VPTPDSSSRAAVAHLLRRTGFGPTAAEVDAAAARGFSATVDALLDFSGPDPADATALPSFSSDLPAGARNLPAAQRQAIAARRRDETGRLITWWLQRMATTVHPLREKLTWFWHGHFATAISKVQRAGFMATQNQIFRSQGAGNFEALTQAVAKDPAMLLWLDAATNVASHPNENFARELMELFTLGIGAYSEQDVKEAARCFTGWRFRPTTNQFTLVGRLHDAGIKTVLGQTGPWGGEDVIHIVTNSPASAPFVVAKLWSHFAYPVAPGDPVVAELAPAFAAGHDVGALVRSMLLHPEFVSDQARNGLVKQPVEWAVGLGRALGLAPGDPRLVAVLRALAQVPFDPPNVAGWPQNHYWLNTASTLLRLRAAAGMAAQADLSALQSVPAAARVDAAAALLSVAAWSDPTRAALGQVAADPRGLLALASVSPEYTLA